MIVLGAMSCLVFLFGFSLQDYANWSCASVFNDKPKPLIFFSIFIENVFEYKFYILTVLALSFAGDYYFGAIDYVGIFLPR